jgi:class 3 adenylate cyclase
MATGTKNDKTKFVPTTRPCGFVLVVDDEEQNRVLLRDSLAAHGYEVEEAENGEKALLKIAAHPPDVILLDLMMPVMDGFEVCRRLKTVGKTAHIPILLVTALSDRQERLMGMAVGANDFLNKPIDFQDVMLRVGNAVYAKHLHDQLRDVQEESELLLLNIFPKEIAERMKQGETNIADSYPEATVLVADLIGFTTLAARINPEMVVQLLNEIFSVFDLLTEKLGLEKIKTMGDAYMAAAGISFPRPDHAEAGAALALELRQEIERQNRRDDGSIRLRIGLSSGPVVAGVIGSKRFAYDIWGETVNLACRLQSTAEAGRIQVSESAYEQLKTNYAFERAQNSSDPPSYWLGRRLEKPMTTA